MSKRDSEWNPDKGNFRVKDDIRNHPSIPGHMISNPLLIFRDVKIIAANGVTIGPINWEVGRNSRVRLECETKEIQEAFIKVNMGLAQPTGGYLEEIKTVKVQSDTYLMNNINLNRAINEYLKSPDAPEYVWLEKRRRSLGVLLDQLGLSPNWLRRSPKHLEKAVMDKYVALRFITSRADLLIGEQIFDWEDPEIFRALSNRWHDFPGAVMVASSRQTLPGPISESVKISRDGRFRSESPLISDQGVAGSPE